jgi:hypothetical protein
VGVFGSELSRIEPPTEPVERFLSMIRFEQRDKLTGLTIDLSELV